MSREISFSGEEIYPNTRKFSKAKDVELQDSSGRFIDAEIGPTEQVHPSTDGPSFIGKPEGSSTNIFGISNTKSPSYTPSLASGPHSSFDNFEMRSGFGRGISSSMQQRALYRSAFRGFDDISTSNFDQRSRDIDYLADTDSSKDVFQPDPPVPPDPSKAWPNTGEQEVKPSPSIEMIQVEDDELELSDVECDSNPKKVFSR